MLGNVREMLGMGYVILMRAMMKKRQFGGEKIGDQAANACC